MGEPKMPTPSEMAKIENEKIFDKLNEHQKLGIETIHYLNELEEVLKNKFNGEEMKIIGAHLGLISNSIGELSERDTDEFHVPPKIMADQLKDNERLKNGDSLLEQLKKEDVSEQAPIRGEKKSTRFDQVQEKLSEAKSSEDIMVEVNKLSKEEKIIFQQQLGDIHTHQEAKKLMEDGKMSKEVYTQLFLKNQEKMKSTKLLMAEIGADNYSSINYMALKFFDLRRKEDAPNQKESSGIKNVEKSPEDLESPRQIERIVSALLKDEKMQNQFSGNYRAVSIDVFKPGENESEKKERFLREIVAFFKKFPNKKSFLEQTEKIKKSPNWEKIKKFQSDYESVQEELATLLYDTDEYDEYKAKKIAEKIKGM